MLRRSPMSLTDHRSPITDHRNTETPITETSITNRAHRSLLTPNRPNFGRAELLLHRAGRLLHRAGRVLHRAGRVLHRAGRVLHRAEQPLHRVRQALHDVRRPLHDENWGLACARARAEGQSPAGAGKCQFLRAKFKRKANSRAWGERARSKRGVHWLDMVHGLHPWLHACAPHGAEMLTESQGARKQPHPPSNIKHPPSFIGCSLAALESS